MSWWSNKIRELTAMYEAKAKANASKPPGIVIHLPQDASLPPLQVPSEVPKQLNGDRAALWFTVFSRTLDEYDTNYTDAVDAADSAVNKVYGHRA